MNMAAKSDDFARVKAFIAKTKEDDDGPTSDEFSNWLPIFSEIEKQGRDKEIHNFRKWGIICSGSFVLLFVASILRIVVFAGLGVLQLSDSVLVALISSTTANVVGILYIAFKWLFPANNAQGD